MSSGLLTHPIVPCPTTESGAGQRAAVGHNGAMPEHEGPIAPQQLRLLHVHAHPDDESSKGAATTAKYVAEGVQVMVATCTGGERGSVLNPRMDRPEVWADIAAIRAREMEAAREILGVEHYIPATYSTNIGITEMNTIRIRAASRLSWMKGTVPR